jgi:hypothetical protein
VALLSKRDAVLHVVAVIGLVPPPVQVLHRLACGGDHKTSLLRYVLHPNPRITVGCKPDLKMDLQSQVKIKIKTTLFISKEQFHLFTLKDCFTFVLRLKSSLLLGQRQQVNVEFSLTLLEWQLSSISALFTLSLLH